MGKFKVSFTTALFVFSFIICVIVAVVFVDRSPRGANDYDAFYDGDKAATGDVAPAEPTEPKWKRHKDSLPPPVATATPTPNAIDSVLAELPIDPNLMGSAQPVPGAAATPMPSPNAMQGKSPDEIARMLMHRGMPTPAATAPSLAMPGGIPTPSLPAAQPPASQSMGVPRGSLPMQSNVGAGASTPGGMGAYSPYQTPSLSSSNAGTNSWNPVSPASDSSGMIGVRPNSSQPEAGMMISRGKNEQNVPAPAGFSSGVTQDGAGTIGSNPASAPPPQLPTGPSSIQPPAQSSGAPPGQQPMLLAPMSNGGSAPNKWNLPPIPTLKPPPVQDPDQRRSDADNAPPEPTTPGGANPEGTPDQAIAVSGTPESAETPAEAKAIAVRVNDVELAKDEAARLAQARALMTKKPLTPDNRESQIKEVVGEWTAVTAAAEQARAKELTVAPDDVEKYAAMHPDLDVTAWKKALQESGFTQEQITERLTELALSEKLVEAKAQEKYPEDKLRKLYEKSPKKYDAPRQVQVVEIFKKKPEDEDKARKAHDAMKRLQRQAAGGTDFGLLARQASEADKPGTSQWLTPAEAKDDPIAKATTELKPGEVSPVLETKDGYRIVKVTEEKPARDDFEGGKELVLEDVKKDLRQDTFAEAKKEQKIEIEPKGQLISTKAEKAKKKEKEAAAKAEPAPEKTEKPKSEVAGKPASEPVDYAKRASEGREAAAAAAAPPTPAGPTVQAMPAIAAAQSGPVAAQPMAGGQPQPASQPGGQTPGPVLGYTPGQTITIGDNQQNAMNPAASTSVNYPVGAVQSNGAANPNNAALMQEARAMQAQAEAQQAAQQQALEYEIQQARAAGNAGNQPTPGPGAPDSPNAPQASAPQGNLNMTATIRKNPFRLPGAPPSTVTNPGDQPGMAAQNLQQMGAGQGQLLAPANSAAGSGYAQGNGQAADVAQPAPAGATPEVMKSNGWTVTKTEGEPRDHNAPRHTAGDAEAGQVSPQQAQAASTSPAPPGFGTPAGESEKPRSGVVGSVKSFFSGFKK